MVRSKSPNSSVADLVVADLVDLPCPRHATRSSARHPPTAAATPSLHPKARASKRRALHRSSGSPAWPWSELAQRRRSATSSEVHRQGEGQESASRSQIDNN